MNIIKQLFFCFIMTFVFINVGFSQDLEIESVAKSEAGKFVSSKIVQSANANSDNIDVTYYNCYWLVDPSQNYISGHVQINFKKVSSTLDTLFFDLSNSLICDSIIFHQQSISFFHQNNQILIPSTAVQQNDAITIYYHGIPSSSGFGSFKQGNHQGAPIVWTLSQPYGAADWWPCKNTLNDKADSIDVFIEVPSDRVAVSNGLLVNQEVNGNNKTFHWKHNFPITTYLIAFAVTNYAQIDFNVAFNNSNTIVQNFVYPEDSVSASTQLLDLIPTMQLYDSLFGVYPFYEEKYGQAQFGWGGGMEHQTISFINNFGHELMAHELAHHWFGDKITCNSWEDIWLNEGFATYLSGLTYEHYYPANYWQQFKVSKINSITSLKWGSVKCDDTTSVGRIFNSRLTYNKGAMILHQLRFILGDQDFFTAIRNYLNDPSLEFKNATTAKLKFHFENVCGRSLDEYFNAWYQGQGYPTYKIIWSQLANNVSLNCSQTTSDSSVSFFKLPVPIQLIGANNDTLITLNNYFNYQNYSITIPFKVDTIIINPNADIITANSIALSQKQENIAHLYFSIIPNPATDYININFNQLQNNFTLQLIDMNGKMLLTENYFEAKEVNLSTSSLSSGVYFIKINAKDFTTGQFVVVNKDNIK
ncbi:MAG: M1 family aminopeptidase [Bacteroidota bacterium]